MRFILLSIFLTLAYSSIAQRPNTTKSPPSQRPKIGQLKGQVVDSENNNPLEYSSISILYLKDSSLIAGGLSGEKGQFFIENIPVGRYLLKIQYMGYNTYEIAPIKFNPAQPIVNLGQIKLSANDAILKTAEVTAERSVFQLGIDKKVFNVDKSMLANAESATEILRNIPTVQVDFDGNVEVRGSAIQVYINGKPTGLTGESQSDILEQLPANTIKSVELITSPSAKYDAEGGGGILNIVLKKNILEGFTGSINGSIGTMANKYRAGANLNFRTNKLNIFSSFSYTHKTHLGLGVYERENIFADSSSFLDEEKNNRRLRKGFFGRIGMDYYINDYNSLTLSARVRPGGGGKTELLDYRFLDSNRKLNSYLNRESNNEQDKFNMTYNLIYVHTFKDKKKKTKQTRKDHSKDENKDKGHRYRRAPKQSIGMGIIGQKHELSFDAQYAYDDRFSDELYIQNLFSAQDSLLGFEQRQETESSRKRKEGTLRLDYVRPLGKTMQIESGYSGRIRQIQQGFFSQTYNPLIDDFSVDTALNNNFDYDQQVHAFYGTFKHKINRFGYMVGLRLEQTYTDAELVTTREKFENDYLGIFPSLHLNYQLGKTQQMQLSYSRRIQRPSTWQLNPFPSYSDAYNLRYGNPFLRPTFTETVELNYSQYFNKTYILASAYYKYNSDLMQRIVQVNDGVSAVTYSNFNNSHVYGVELVSRYTPFKWWMINLSGSIYQSVVDGIQPGDNFQYTALMGNVNFNSTLSFKFGMRVNIMVNYTPPRALAQGRMAGHSWNSISVSQKVLKNKGSITLNVENPVLGGRYIFETSGPNFDQTSEYRREAPIVYLRFQYKFGKLNVRDRRPSRASRLGRDGGDRDGGDMGM